MRRVNRRKFMQTASGSVTAGLFTVPLPTDAPAAGADPAAASPLADIPIFCAHEHWGSIDAIGTIHEGYRADVEAGSAPLRPAGVWDIVCDPYFGGWLAAAGADPGGMARAAGHDSLNAWWSADPQAALDAMRPHLMRQTATGAFQSIRLGILQLHGVDIAALDIAAWRQADTAIRAAYGELFGWYQDAMAKAHFSALVRPVHPEFHAGFTQHPGAARERVFTWTVLRIDPLLGLHGAKNERRDRLAAWLGVDPGDADSWRLFLERLFERCAADGCVGIKQLQAYSRPLDFAPHGDAAVRFSGDLHKEEARAFQDWMAHACCALAHERGWPHQVHVGTHNLRESSPLPLEPLARRYSRMPLVLLHCWPFLEESGWLAKHVSNVYLDTCWMPVLNPAFLERAYGAWLAYLPHHKIMCSQDATSVEMAAGSAVITRRTLDAAMAAMAGINEAGRAALAAAMLHENAEKIYGV